MGTWKFQSKQGNVENSQNENQRHFYTYTNHLLTRAKIRWKSEENSMKRA